MSEIKKLIEYDNLEYKSTINQNSFIRSLIYLLSNSIDNLKILQGLIKDTWDRPFYDIGPVIGWNDNTYFRRFNHNNYSLFVSTDLAISLYNGIFFHR